MMWLLLLALTAHAETGLSASYAAESSGDYPAALEALAGARAPAYVLHLRRGWLLYLSGEHDASERAYAEAVAAAPQAVEARLGRTLPLMAARRWVDAEAACREVLRLAPGDPTARSRLAWALYNQGRFAESAEVYREAVAAWPSDVDLRAGLGWALCRAGREAAEQFEQVLALSPEHASATEGLAACPR